MHRSHLTQVLLNYFDETDTRVRELPNTLDAQLLNVAACRIEESGMRFSRELAARSFQAPLNLDNAGVWQAARLPSGAGVSSVEGWSGSQWVPLTLYNDLLPVPSGIVFDRSRDSVPLPSPVLFRVEGTGTPVQVAGFPMAIANQLHFWLEADGDAPARVSIRIEGKVPTRSLWISAPETQTEAVVAGPGMSTTVHTWESVTAIEIQGLASGSVLTAVLFPFALGYTSDPSRPYAHPAYRGVLFDRYWTAAGTLLNEVYYGPSWNNFELIQSYRASQPLTGLALEPNTYGALVYSDSGLWYSDRREPMPQALARTALYEEPFYGLDVSLDPDAEGRRLLNVNTLPFAEAGGVVRYRLKVEIPGRGERVLLADGTLLQAIGSTGWRRGVPFREVSFPADTDGDYIFTLETMDGYNHITQDVAVFGSLAFQPAAQLNVRAVAPVLKGVGFDSRQRLWLWSGDFLVPARLVHDSYLVDGDSLYCCEPYEKVRIA